MRTGWLAAVLSVLLLPSSLAAQETESGEVEQAQVAPIVEREVFEYGGVTRRDPFKPLEAGSELGPRFEDLELSGIIYSPEAGSIVVLVDRNSERRFRVWEGDVIGGATLVRVTPNEATFTVTVFGVSRQETLRVKRNDKEQGG